MDHTPEEIVKFGKSFQSRYLNMMQEQAQCLKNDATSINDTLKGTEFANNSAEKVIVAADKILQAVDEGEERIQELIRKAEREIEIMIDLKRRAGGGR